MDSLPSPTSGLTINADYHSGNQVWSTHTNAYESWTDANYASGYYSVSAPQDGGSGAHSARYSAASPAGVVAAGAYVVIFRRHIDGTAANDTPIGSGSSTQLASVILASAASAASLNPGNGSPFNQDFNCLTGAYWSQSITITGLNSTGWTQYVWTLKGDATLDSDAEALIAIRVSAGGSGSDGLLVNNGRAAASAADGSLVVSEVSPDTTVTWIADAAAMDVPPSPQNDDYWWELTRWIGGQKEVIGSGRVVLARSVRRSVTAP